MMAALEEQRAPLVLPDIFAGELSLSGRYPRRLALFPRIGLAFRALLEIMVAAAAIRAAFGGGFGVEYRDHSQECTKRFPVAAIA
jgi:hypothetical protein